LVSGKKDMRNPAITLTRPKIAMGAVGWIEAVCATKGATIPPALAKTEQMERAVFLVGVA
jgi:hypothetical protein